MDVKGRDVDGFVKEAEAKLKNQVKLPEGYWIEWGGAFENQQRAMARLAVIVPLTIGLIFILLYTAFNSVAHATLIIANVPFAVIGGVFGLFDHRPVRVGALGGRLHRRVRRGHAQRHRAGLLPQ
jgi:cobalt-zinc-cadmium resistance protein CzcA